MYLICEPCKEKPREEHGNIKIGVAKVICLFGDPILGTGNQQHDNKVKLVPQSTPIIRAQQSSCLIHHLLERSDRVVLREDRGFYLAL